MKSILTASIALLLARPCMAQVAAYDYFIGNVKFTEDAASTVIHVKGASLVANLPGGHTWPKLLVDDAGTIYAGGVAIDSKRGALLAGGPGAGEVSQVYPAGLSVEIVKGAYRIARDGRRCSFTPAQLGLRGAKPLIDAMKDDNVRFAASPAQVLALVTRYDEAPDSRYLVAELDLAGCKVRMSELGDPDLLVELGRSDRGGWWLTGSIEQTLLRSNDGRVWRRATLPPDVSALVSSHVVSDDEIWLAAAMPGSGDDDPLLLHTQDGGKTWRNVRLGDPSLARLPRGWLEGHRRLGQAKSQAKAKAQSAH